MENINNFDKETACYYKDEFYSARDNGSVLRHSKENHRKRKYDDEWTFGTTINEKGYPCIGSEVIHRIVATAFLGNPPSKNHVVDHINTNRQDNRPSNLRWVTRLENIILNPITCKKIEKLTEMKIDDVLKNIDVLYEYSLPSNLAWMRRVTQAESDSCFENLTKWAKSDFDKNSSYKGSLGDWIFKTRRNLFAYEYPQSFEKEDGTKTDVIKSLSPLAAQYKTHWKIPAEFPCCPTEITCEPLKGYLEKLLPGNIFCRTQKYTSLVLEAALYKDKIIVKTQNKALDSIKPWAILHNYF